MQPDTVTVIAGRPAKQPGTPLNAPITLASSFHAGGDFEYGRHGNPAYESFEQVVGALEGGRALAFASGIATAAATLGLVEPGAVVVLPRHGYNGTTSLVQSGPYEVRLIDPSDTESSIEAFAGADLVWLESPTNPAMEVGDLPTLVAAAKDAGALVAVDNTFRTPLRDRPLSYGADIVAHSASKLLGGHSDLVLGVMATADDALFERLLQHRSLHGAIPGALESFLAARGVRTLAVRLDRAESSAAILADRLKAHPAVAEVRYPGFGTMVCFVIDDAEHAQRATEASRVITHATSLGGVESTWERRRRFPAEPETIPAGLIRLSVGIEAVEDLWADIENALG
ncbi:cystathionine gamma-synthase [Aeromicrobium sp. 636]|uniref:PLP-dependent transferase n=1 Tax=Aeromicrobium senzhongii TaxID=2663859 RepID=A0A8I0JZ52_9ACTN|nr:MULTISPECIES: PLP-dependent aspartate aminotransferase family protein [Aeromicrobium]MBC9225592.1 PLP-dependent transferase [Aeromicrobium senzhongii]MCQ3997701.1 cystathionine gamma-synthase [Aeromicrobium sp. 636]